MYNTVLQIKNKRVLSNLPLVINIIFIVQIYLFCVYAQFLT